MNLGLDTNVVVSVLLWNGSPRTLLLRLIRSDNVRLFTSLPLFGELNETLLSRKCERKIAASLLSVDQLVDFYAGCTSLVQPVSMPRIAPDPDDEVVIGTELSSKANLIVTGDQGLRSNS